MRAVAPHRLDWPRSMAAIDWTTEVLDQFETHWQDRLRPRLDGLTDEEYFWEPVPGCWSIHPRGGSTAPSSWGTGKFTWDYGPDPHPAPVTTIAWRLGHLIESFASTNGVYFGGPRVDAETLTIPARPRPLSRDSTRCTPTSLPGSDRSVTRDWPSPKVTAARRPSPTLRSHASCST
jgi:hypothetical protein